MIRVEEEINWPLRYEVNNQIYIAIREDIWLQIWAQSGRLLWDELRVPIKEPVVSALDGD